MPRPRARTIGLQRWRHDSLAMIPGHPFREATERLAKMARKAEARDASPEPRTCPTCQVRLNRYTVGPLCRLCSRKALVEGGC